MKVKANILDKLEGIELTEEQKNALSNVELDIPGVISKEIFDKKASETAELSRKLKENQSQSETLEQSKEAEMAELKAEIEGLKKDKLATSYKAKYLSMGYAEDLAMSTANALIDGDMDTVFANQVAFNQAQVEKTVNDTLNNQPSLSKGKTLTKESAEELEKAQMRKAFGLPY